MSDADPDRRRFEQLALPHLDAAYNLARWLTRDDHDADDVVQDACERALRYIGGLRGEDARPWLLRIVRHTCYSWLRSNRPAERLGADESEHALEQLAAPEADEPQAAALRRAERLQLDRAIAALPVVFREVLVLRELEDCSYAEIARIADLPIGTVMSRLARARAQLRQALLPAAAARPALRAINGGGRE